MLQTSRCRADDSAASAGTDDAQSGTVLLAEVPLVVFSSANHPLASRATATSIRRDELGTHTVFISDARGCFFDLVRDFFKSDIARVPRLEATGSVEAVKQSVFRNQVGLGVLPIYAIAEEIRSGRLRRWHVRPELPRMRLEAMSYRARRPAHPAVAALLEAVRRIGTEGPAASTRPSNVLVRT